VPTHIDAETFERVQAFHGHLCPGLTIGIRVAGIALREIGPHAADEEVTAVVETNNCAVDAIQFLTGCTLGKGNLIHLDYGKNAFTFARRSDGKAIRILTKPRERHSPPEEAQIVSRVRDGSASDQDHVRYREIWRRNALAILDLAEDELFEVQTLKDYALPRKAEIHPSIRCDCCGEMTMSSRIMTIDGRNLCPGCRPVLPREPIIMEPIGVIRNELAPGQAPPRAKSPRSVIQIDARYADGLRGLQTYERLDVLYCFNRLTGDERPMLQHPRGDKTRPPRGVFALRSPRRPNPIGLTTVRLLQVDGGTLVVEGLDAWDGTPVLDIKPHM